MTQIAVRPGRVWQGAGSATLYVAAIFVSAGLVFLVEPIAARLLLPLLGGSPAVWNASLAFFQGALLAGYGYAHLLQRLRSLRTQIGVHLGVLVLAGLALPLRVTDIIGSPPADAPALWLLGALALSLGAPFAALSATAPLVQAWRVRTLGEADAHTAYVLYAASNVGSLIALIAYPVLVEPNLPLHVQTQTWSLGYDLFIVIAGILGVSIWRSERPIQAVAQSIATEAITWRQRATWIVLAAIPSSLMLGATTYITTDLGSAPFLWVAPLALYLVTFIVAFQERPAIPPRIALILQAAAAALCALYMNFWKINFLEALSVQLAAFFFSALICHQALAARRPGPARLTEFYLWLSAGGVVGGAFNAFAAPLIFSSPVEYPAVLVLACLMRPWGKGALRWWEWSVLGVGLATAVVAVVSHTPTPAWMSPQEADAHRNNFVGVLFLVTAVCAVLLQTRGLIVGLLVLALIVSTEQVSSQAGANQTWRSFFGVMRVSTTSTPDLGQVKFLTHGTTMHGGQSQTPAFRCRPLLYYAPDAPIGQVFRAEAARKSALSIGAVGLGTGAIATYTRLGDRLSFFEIDPLVLKVAHDPANFTYLTACAHGQIDYTLGDARLTLSKIPAGAYDVLLIDAFSSDSVPTHLLTVEAMRMYLTKIRPDGVVILHLSNFNLDLIRPAEATALAAGGVPLMQHHAPPPGSSVFWSPGEDAVIIARTPAALATFVKDPRWQAPAPGAVQAWTDDYSDVFGALTRRLAARWGAIG
ncbi:MAG TPA: fused MFS/spermidine synthase [Caulobacteraceae bacterium]|jgi:hypothetical protein